jgi:hypothetical protein
MKFTDAQVREVYCIRCDAAPGEACTERSMKLVTGYHKERGNLRKKFPVNLDELVVKGSAILSPTDKSVIVYYAYVMLCDSVSANSEKIMGKFISSADIQRMFAKEGLDAARKDGIIKK